MRLLQPVTRGKGGGWEERGGWEGTVEERRGVDVYSIETIMSTQDPCDRFMSGYWFIQDHFPKSWGSTRLPWGMGNLRGERWKTVGLKKGWGLAGVGNDHVEEVKEGKSWGSLEDHGGERTVSSGFGGRQLVLASIDRCRPATTPLSVLTQCRPTPRPPPTPTPADIASLGWGQRVRVPETSNEGEGRVCRGGWKLLSRIYW